ncbi:hypothetical protein [Streptomyces sp. NPDC052693]|uniref:NucA/NucB deoxyribonuclease domain-containing protein n=1 Tax=Streptomyces sp. NPDC052693 TaxID=3155814 RepID=UPI00343B1743
MRLQRRTRGSLAVLAAGAVVAGTLQATAWADSPSPGDRPSAPAVRHSIPADERVDVLGADYKASTDIAWTTTGDAQGFHLLTATEKSGYAWKTLVSLAEPGFDADQWIGNVCVTGSGKRAVVVYAPRTFTNSPALMARGGFTALVDLTSGKTTKLKVNASLSYYNPGCGTGEEAVLTQSPGEDRKQTRLIRVNAATAELSEPVVVNGQVTSSVPAGKGTVVAASGRTLVEIGRQGKKRKLTTTGTVPYRITRDADGGYVFLERVQRDGLKQAETTLIRRWAHAKTTGLGRGPLGNTGLTRRAGQVYVTGAPRLAQTLPQTITALAGADKDATLSTHGTAIVQRTAWADGKGSPKYLHPETATDPRSVAITTTVRDSGHKATFTVTPLQAKSANWAMSRTPSPLLGRSYKKKAAGKGGMRTNSAGRTLLSGEDPGDVTGTRTEVVESERTCSVPRSDVRNQAMQPKPRQVEWAVNKAITGMLNVGASRPANWKNLGMPAYSPQSLFLNPPLQGGGRVPAQVMLGITAQESNMWQAARSTVPGVTGNPLIGNYYGIDLYDGNTDNDWDVDWSEADCGYGITQVTDHMRLAGREHGKGGTAWDYQKQRAVALDYAANVAAGLQILVDKWNQTKRAGLVVHDGDPNKLENWFFALWAYNSGFYENVNGNEPWGVGWANNPANPEWDAGRSPFMEDSLGNEDPADAARPQHWPYPEKVLGFAAHPPAYLESPGTMVPAFRAAWWNGTSGDATISGSAKYNRAKVKPPEDLFCGPYNWCEPSKISDGAQNEPGQGPCTRDDFQCWFHQSVQWKTDCSYSCGNEFFRFPSPDYDAEQADGTAYPPTCTRSGLPSGAIIIDDAPAGAPSVRPSCSNSDWSNEGSFTLDFGAGEAGIAHDGQTISTVWPAKVDLHQLGAGFGGHFYFGHTRADDAKGQRLKITGTWRLNRELDTAAKVMVHLPDHGAQAQDVRYRVKTAQGWKEAPPVNQLLDGGEKKNRWVSLGAYQFTGAVPEVQVDTLAPGGTGDIDIAFDAVAFIPGDYSGMPQITFPDPDPNAPEIDYDDQKMIPIPTPPLDFPSVLNRGEKSATAGSAPAKKCGPQDARTGRQLCIQVNADAARAAAKTASAQAGGLVPACDNQAVNLYNRYEACISSDRSDPIVATLTERGTPIGSASWDIDQQVKLYKNENAIDQQITFTPVRFTGALTNVTLNMKADCFGPCESGQSQWAGSRTWLKEDLHRATFGQPSWWTGTTGKDSLILSWTLTATTTQTPDPAMTSWSDNDLVVRCDVIMGNEEVPETKPGCVFPTYTPTLTINTKKYPAAAALYWLLIEKLDTHPGGKKYNSPLSRQGNEAIVANNRKVICDGTFNPVPNGTTATGTKPSCDEYPFASSRQSGGGSVTSGSQCAQFYAVKNGTRWSLKYDTSSSLPTWKELCGRGSIPLDQNTGAGGQLGRFTTAMRLHDEDKYYIDVPGFSNCNLTACDLP